MEEDILICLLMTITVLYGYIFLIKKSKAFIIFQQLKELVENQVRKLLKNFRTDHGG